MRAPPKPTKSSKVVWITDAVVALAHVYAGVKAVLARVVRDTFHSAAGRGREVAEALVLVDQLFELTIHQ